MGRDVRVLLWREGRELRRQALTQTLVILFFFLVGAFLVPHLYLSVGQRRVVDLWPLDAVVMLVSLWYAALLSESSFLEDRKAGVLAALLASPVSPSAIFFARWLRVVLQTATLALSLNVSNLVTLTFYACANGEWEWLSFAALLRSAGLLVVSLILCSYMVAANCAVSILLRNDRLCRLLSGLTILPPLLGLLLLYKCIGVATPLVLTCAGAGFIVVLCTFSAWAAITALNSQEMLA